MDDLKSLLNRLDAHVREGPSTQDGFTSTELADVAGFSQATAQRRIRELVRRGDIHVAQLHRTNLHGVTKPVPGYRIVERHSADAAA